MARKLLLADDSITIQKVVELVLADEDFEIRSVSNGEEALSVLSALKPDVVLADIEMPKMNGYQLCEKIKTNPATKNIPVILLAGAFEPLEEELVRQVKADSYVIKPFESQELISKINAALISPAAEEKEEFAAEAAEEVVAEAVSAGEDLWSMEELPAEVAAEAVPEEIASAEEASAPAETAETAETEDISFGDEIAVSEEAAIMEELVAEKISPPPSGVKFVEKTITPEPPARAVEMPEFSLPSKEELAIMFKRAVDERVSTSLAAMDIKNALLSTIMPSLKDSVEKVLWEVAPELTEKVLRDILQSSLASLGKEVEKVIWETVPEVAERMIAKEIEKIRSEK